ncbi:MAG: FecR domain-containing protein [Bacillota bacterium]
MKKIIIMVLTMVLLLVTPVQSALAQGALSIQDIVGTYEVRMSGELHFAEGNTTTWTITPTGLIGFFVNGDELPYSWSDDTLSLVYTSNVEDVVTWKTVITIKFTSTVDGITGQGTVDTTQTYENGDSQEDKAQITLKKTDASVTSVPQATSDITQEPSEEPEETDEPEETVEPQATPSKTQLPDSGAAFSDLSGQVEVLIPTGYDANGKPEWDEEAWTFAKLDMPLPEGTRIKTSDRSSVVLSFADMTTFVMKPESEIYLSKPEAGAGPFRLLIGNLWVNMKKGIIDGTMDIEMSQAASGIKGTTFVLEDNGETSTLKVIEGTVEFTSKATGESVMVKGGETVSATADGLGEVKTFDANAEMADWAEYGAKMPAEGFPLWAIVAIGVGALLVMGIILVVIISNRKKRKSIRVAGMSPTYTQSPQQHDPIVYPPNQSEQTTSGSQPIHPSFCTQCGSRMEPNAAFCPSCGKKAN